MNRRHLALVAPLVLAMGAGAPMDVAPAPELPNDPWREPKRGRVKSRAGAKRARSDAERHRLKRRKLAKAGRRAARGKR